MELGRSAFAKGVGKFGRDKVLENESVQIAL